MCQGDFTTSPSTADSGASTARDTLAAGGQVPLSRYVSAAWNRASPLALTPYPIST